jgi:uncharacterized protein YceH (UPF0502 family)
MELNLSAEEVRLLGVLAEKQMTTPEYYPLSLNALTVGCNQKSNRSPVVNYEESEVLEALENLRRHGWVIVVTGGGSRVRKYEHKLKDKLFLSQKEQAALCVLMVRGPQTVGEIRTRTERMVEFPDLTDVEETLRDLAAAERTPQPLAMMLPRFSGQKENRYIHLISGKPDVEKLSAEEASETFAGAGSSSAAHLSELEEKVENLTRELENLKKQFEQLKKQFE